MMLITALLLVFGVAPADAKVTRYLTGDAADVDPPLSGPVFDLGGGGEDVAEAFQALIDGVRGCTDCAAKVDVVVLRTSGADGYNEFVAALAGVTDAIRAAGNDGQATGVAMKELKKAGAVVNGKDVSAAVKQLRS